MTHKVQNTIIAVTITILVLALAATSVYDRSPQDLWDRLVYKLNLVDVKPNHTYLPDFYYNQVTFPLPHSYHNITSVEEFEMWRNTPGGIQHEWSDRPTVQDIPTNITAKTIKVSERAGYTLTKLHMDAFFDPDVITFYELVPDVDENPQRHNLANPTVYDAVLLIPGSGHTGALDVLGEDGPWKSKYYHENFAQTVAQEGYATYVIELRGYGERFIDAGDGCENDDLRCSAVLAAKKMGSLGISMNDIRNDEITQVLAWIESRSYIGNIAVGGLSLGGALALDQAIINKDTIKGVLIASGISSKIHSPLSMGASGNDMTNCCDTSDYAVSIAPMPAYVSYGLLDSETVWEIETGHTAGMMADAYKLHDASEDFWYVIHDRGHVYDTESVLEFLKKYLESVY